MDNQKPDWYSCIDENILKARHGKYVLYDVDYLLNNLVQEVYIMESARRMSGKDYMEVLNGKKK